MSQHTPGPWTAVECCDSCPLPSGVAVAVQTDREPWTSIGRICSMTAQGDGKYDPSVTNANARLIAAAPELLAVLNGFVVNEALMDDPEMRPVRNKLFALASDLIAKVRTR